jgi:hypothetical protein
VRLWWLIRDHIGLGNFLVPKRHLEANNFMRRRPIMKPVTIQRYTNREMIQDAFIVLTPAILTLGIVWFFWNELVIVP